MSMSLLRKLLLFSQVPSCRMPNASLDKCNSKWSIVRFCGASSQKGLDGAEGVLLSEGGDVGEVFAKSLIYRII